jgi:hypothetical protein
VLVAKPSDLATERDGERKRNESEEKKRQDKTRKKVKKHRNGKYISGQPNIAARDGFADLAVVVARCRRPRRTYGDTYVATKKRPPADDSAPALLGCGVLFIN